MRKQQITQEITQEQKDNLVTIQVTLDGEPAMIIGRIMPYPLVRTRDMSKHYSYSWEAIQRIVAQGGNFKSGE